jgi:hypothetical protein
MRVSWLADVLRAALAVGDIVYISGTYEAAS